MKGENFTNDEHEPQENSLLLGTRHPAFGSLWTWRTVTVIDHGHLKTEQVELHVQKAGFNQCANNY